MLKLSLSLKVTIKVLKSLYKVTSDEKLSLSPEGCCLEAGGQVSAHNHHSVHDLSWQHGGMCCPQSGTLLSFSALTPVIG